jgi:hypothetical protein
MNQISPIRTLTRLDRIQPSDLYRAGDFQGIRPRWLHLSGQSLTEDVNYSWYGTKRQFREICKRFEWDGLSLVSDPKKRS